MGFQEVVAKVKGSDGSKKVAAVTMTNGRKFVFNAIAGKLLGDITGMKAAVLVDAETGSIGFRFNKSASNPVEVGKRFITVKANISHVLPEGLRTEKWRAIVEWNKEAQVFEAKFGEAVKAPKRGEGKAAEVAAE
jgi:hypothetical protein